MRPVPELAISWTDGKNAKRYVTRHGAYYAIAKRLVLAKYPAGITNASWGDEWWFAPAGWTQQLFELRRDKAQTLFQEDPDGHSNGEHFCTKRFRSFVKRVARYLAHVDKKRGDAARVEARSLADVQKAYERTERAATELAAQAARYLKIIKGAEALRGR